MSWTQKRKSLPDVAAKVANYSATRVDPSTLSGTVEVSPFKVETTKGGKVKMSAYLKGGPSVTIYLAADSDLIADLQSGETFTLSALASAEYDGRRSNEGHRMVKYTDRWDGGNLSITGLRKGHKVKSVKVASAG